MYSPDLHRIYPRERDFVGRVYRTHDGATSSQTSHRRRQSCLKISIRTLHVYEYGGCDSCVHCTVHCIYMAPSPPCLSSPFYHFIKTTTFREIVYAYFRKYEYGVLTADQRSEPTDRHVPRAPRSAASIPGGSCVRTSFLWCV